MGVVRNSAQNLSNFVVRHTSPGSKEWAEAIASELSAIDNEWHALWWAVGGLRVLFYSRPKPLHTCEDLNAAAQKYADRRRLQVNDVWLGRNLAWLVILIPALLTLPRVLYGADRLGSIAVTLGLLNLSFLQYSRSREPDVPDRDDSPGLVRFYREELVRSTKVFSLTFWIFPACVVLVAIGYELTMTYRWERVLGFLWLAFLMLFFSRQRSDRRRLEQIDVLLSTDTPSRRSWDR